MLEHAGTRVTHIPVASTFPVHSIIWWGTGGKLPAECISGILLWDLLFDYAKYFRVSSRSRGLGFSSECSALVWIGESCLFFFVWEQDQYNYMKYEGEDSVWLVFELWFLKEAYILSIELWRTKAKCLCCSRSSLSLGREEGRIT